jgi:hypothetical protein
MTMASCAGVDAARPLMVEVVAMRPPGLAEHDQHSGRAGRPSRREGVGRGRSLVLIPALVAIAWALLIAVFASVSRLVGPEGERGTWAEVVGAVVGNFAMAFVIALAVSAIVRASRRRETSGAVRRIDWGPPNPAGRGQPARDPNRYRPVMSQVARRGTLGALPGLLIIVVPLLLHEFGVISSDQSQVGFMGVPLLIIGTLLGSATAGSESGCAGAALLGAGAGFVVGLASGLRIAAIGAGLAGIWLFLTPVCMITGATLATYLRLRHADRHDPE